jgi:hypothetical protein
MLKLWYFSEVWSKTLISQTLLYRYTQRNRRNSLEDAKINSNYYFEEISTWCSVLVLGLSVTTISVANHRK